METIKDGWLFDSECWNKKRVPKIEDTLVILHKMYMKTGDELIYVTSMCFGEGSIKCL